MVKQLYVITSGANYEYSFDALLRGNSGADLQALFDEFIDAFHATTPPFAVPEPEWDYRADPDRDEYDLQYQGWKDAAWDHAEAAIREWNRSGYRGDSKIQLYVSWLVKDKGFDEVGYVEQNTDYLREKDESYYRVEMPTPAPGPEGGAR